MAHDAKRQQFRTWAAAVRASVDRIQALARQGREKEQALEHVLQSSAPDPDALRTLTLDRRARRLEIEGLIAALPTLDEIGQTSEVGGAARALRRPRLSGETAGFRLVSRAV
ncbi:MAG: hypothetical protein E6J55_12205 [Deltaproteobacteria bacterium]|nr:MAG: hypothetical protein E6J55_12205 [Deltaproteobacteria bacterium]